MPVYLRMWYIQKLIDTKRASVQGIGVLSQAEETTYEGEEDGA